MYAIWWNEFILDYDANGGNHGPEESHGYTNEEKFEFTVNPTKMLYAIWGEN